MRSRLTPSLNCSAFRHVLSSGPAPGPQSARRAVFDSPWPADQRHSRSASSTIPANRMPGPGPVYGSLPLTLEARCRHIPGSSFPNGLAAPVLAPALSADTDCRCHTQRRGRGCWSCPRLPSVSPWYPTANFRLARNLPTIASINPAGHLRTLGEGPILPRSPGQPYRRSKSALALASAAIEPVAAKRQHGRYAVVGAVQHGEVAVRNNWPRNEANIP